MILATQNLFDAPIELRRRCEIFAIWPANADLDIIMKRLPLAKSDKQRINKYIDDNDMSQHDVLYIDLARDRANRIRFNNELLPLE